MRRGWGSRPKPAKNAFFWSCPESGSVYIRVRDSTGVVR